MLRGLDNDVITLVKKSGKVMENIKAFVQPKVIFISDIEVPIEEGDHLYRDLPNGLSECYLVLDRGYHSKIRSIQAHYQVKVRKESSIELEQVKSVVNVYNASGNNSRINIDSTDYSINNVEQQERLFDQINEKLDEIKDIDEKKACKDALHELRVSIGTKNALAKYQDFIANIANHIVIITPFIPALTKLL